MNTFFEFLVEVIIESIGNITGKSEPEKMPDDLELKKEFVVKHYPLNTIFCFLILIIGLGISICAYLGNGLAFSCLFAVPTIAIFILSIYMETDKYTVDENKITHSRFLFKNKVVFWESVHSVKIYERTNDSSVYLCLYSKDKLLIDFTTPMKNFWNIPKLADHLGYEIIFEKDASLKKMLHP